MDRDAFFHVTYGLYLVCSRDQSNYNGHVSNTVFQVTADPPQFVVASHKNNLTTRYIEKSGVFSISVLQQDVDLEFLGPWGFKSGESVDKFKEVSYKIGISGAPVVLEKTTAWIECRVTGQIDSGTHILFIGQVIDAGVLQRDARPLTYKYYREAIKGLSPEKAPTYTGGKVEFEHREQVSLPVKSAGKYQCKICGYIYDPAEGDPDSGIPAGTAFEDIPDDWYCPVCGVTKKDFIAIDD